jgi:hypothetical protein
MHVAHFHPPRAVAVTLIAAVLAIVITLALASRVSDISAGSAASAGQNAPGSRLVRSLPWAHHSTRVGSTPAWLANPFSPLLSGRITTSWTVRGGS